MASTRQTVNFCKNYFEKEAWTNGQLVAGLDEVGRGCLAGPLVTAAVMLPLNKPHRCLKDSKLMNLEEREKAYGWIIKHCAYQVGIVHNRIIDNHNIWHSTLIAMKKALIHLLAQNVPTPRSIVVDAMPLNLKNTSAARIPLYHFIKGERKSSTIAAASIIAKVTRDRLMNEYERAFPGYKLGQHKGYSTPAHKNCITEQGHTILHRHSFIDHIINPAQMEHNEQQTLC